MQTIKELFPIYKKHPELIYLDSSATVLKPQIVLDKMDEYYCEYGVNIHRGVYDLSYQATQAYEKARENVASFINAEAREIIFTQNTTDALNMIALMLKNTLQVGDEVLSTELEHHSSILPWIQASSEIGFNLKYIPLTIEGKIVLDNVKKMINEKTKILVITYVSNVLGFVTPLEEIIAYAHAHNVKVIVDAAQAVAHLNVDVKKLDCDYLAFSGHKMFGPTGIGVLYGKYHHLKNLKPIKTGGDMNEEVDKYSFTIKPAPYCFEAGTPMIAEAIGLSAAVDFIKALGYEKIRAHEEALVQEVISELVKLPYIQLYNPGAELGIVSFNFKNLHPHDAASFFANKNIALRAGHHCAELVSRFFNNKGSLRASIYIYNDLDEIKIFIKTVKEVYQYFKDFMED